MNAAILLARASPRVRDDCITSRLGRFTWRHRAAVSSLAGRHARLADLAVSFPALLFALAVPRRRFDPEPVIERAIAGAPLSELAAAADMPMWTRRLGPETFQRSLPRLPDSPLFRRQIANHPPASAKTAALWLDTVASTAFWGHEGLAVWFARRVGKREDWEALRRWQLITLWAWHAANPTAPASRFVRTPWTPDISTRAALVAARDWKENVTAALELGDRVVADAWADPAVVDGYSFEPIQTLVELIDGSHALDNCVRTYAAAIAGDSQRLWIVKRDGAPVAMLGLEAHPVPSIFEISGVSNSRVPPEIALTAHRWFREHAPLQVIKGTTYAGTSRKRWAGMWRGYWLAKRLFPRWLPLAPVESLYFWLEEPRQRRRHRRRLRVLPV
ncbi:MAG: hypothetical protein Q8R02_20795 [Hyphomonadaceae bacterium]|nr:hypothetical protein [Hyphomonadaceae bacterium]